MEGRHLVFGRPPFQSVESVRNVMRPTFFLKVQVARFDISENPVRRMDPLKIFWADKADRNEFFLWFEIVH